MHLNRIAELLEPFLGHSPGDPAHSLKSPSILSPAQLQNISAYIDLLLRWNSRINLTAVRQPEEIVTRHFGESLFAARHLFPSPLSEEAPPPAVSSGRDSGKATSPRVIDVGSGAGFPGLPIKIWAPAIHLTLIESTQKKAIFLREVIRTLTLTDVDVFAGRAVDFIKNDLPRDDDRQASSPKVRGEVVTLRAVERFESILPTAARLIAPAGRLAILVGGSQTQRARNLVPDLSWSEPVWLPLSTNRALIIGSKEPRQAT
jgi:16S rRNA (guanine527-N7)-methyltransferase